jgi:outer membrane protein assembly factor BamA
VGLPHANAGRLAVTLLLTAASGFGCASIPRGMAAVDGINVEGNHAVSSKDIGEKIATTSSPKFLEIFRGVIYDYSLYDKSVLQRDLERVERYYRARGYYEAKARAARVHYKSGDHVGITIEVEEGLPVLIRHARIDGMAHLSEDEVEAVREAMRRHIKAGATFEEEPFKNAAAAIRRALANRGRAWAKVERRADVDLPAHYASLFFTIRPGPKARFGRVTIEGLGELPPEPVLRAIDIDPEDTYSEAEVDSAERAVLDLGTFSSVDIAPVLADDPPSKDAVVPLHVRVERQKLKSLLLGGGVQLDPIRFDTHLRIGWEHKNLFGGFRHFTVSARPGLVLYPTRLPTFQAPTAVLPEERFRAELRQPGFIEARTNGVLSQELNTYPVLLSPQVDPEAPVVGYLEYKGSAGLERTWWKLLGAPAYNIQYNRPFTYQGALDPDLLPVVISYIDLLGQFDFRDNKTRPHEGFFIQNDFQFAGLGGDALDFRVQPEVRGYIPLGKQVTLASRATVGFLFPMNYGERARAARAVPPDLSDRAGWVRDIELIYLRGFFSGGPSSNRGYPLRGVGPHGAVPFLNPDLQSQALAASCDLNNPDYDIIRCGVPLGGQTLWEASLEVRFPIAGNFSGSTFCDASDVSPESVDIRLDHPHLSCGIGLRYDTPIGPIRVDAGYRIPGAQVPRGTDPRLEGDPGTVYGVPIALAFGIGEAF